VNPKRSKKRAISLIWRAEWVLALFGYGLRESMETSAGVGDRGAGRTRGGRSVFEKLVPASVGFCWVCRGHVHARMIAVDALQKPLRFIVRACHAGKAEVPEIPLVPTRIS
jgi:hypothetical protein